MATEEEATTTAQPNGPESISDEKKKEAEDLKAEANALFADLKFLKASDLYSRAIELNPFVAAYYGNRAAADLKIERFGSVIVDATKALELDPSFVKAYYRRGTAYFALRKYKQALRDYRAVVTVRPKDPDARAKLAACEKAAKAAAFEAAISSKLTESAWEALAKEPIEVESTYTGVHLPQPLTLEAVHAMIEAFKSQQKIHRKYVADILQAAHTLLHAEPSLNEVDACPRFTVCGDTHGQFYDLLNIFKLNGFPSPTNPYLFNGDFVDRGSFSCEVIITLLAFKVLYPKHLYLNRGNHETKNMNQMYGFEGEVKQKYGVRTFELFSSLFQHLPLGALLGKSVLVVHGGLFSQDGVTLDDIRKVDRVREPPDSGVMTDLLWSDPAPAGVRGRSPSKRGVGVCFGADVTERFCAENNLKLIVRAHEVKEQGYAIEAGGKCATVFSAPNYCDQVGNKGAYVTFDEEMTPKYTSFEAVPHPNLPPMYYSNMSSMF